MNRPEEFHCLFVVAPKRETPPCVMDLVAADLAAPVEKVIVALRRVFGAILLHTDKWGHPPDHRPRIRLLHEAVPMDIMWVAEDDAAEIRRHTLSTTAIALGGKFAHEYLIPGWIKFERRWLFQLGQQRDDEIRKTPSSEQHWRAYYARMIVARQQRIDDLAHLDRLAVEGEF